jgi:hypothetical protein
MNLIIKLSREIDPRIEYQLFENLISEFNAVGDLIMSEVFMPLLGESKVEACVVLAKQAERDAWAGSHDGKPAMFFNLEKWPEERVKSKFVAVMKHEMTHLLLGMVLKNPERADYAGRLEHIVLNEGLAHFMGRYTSVENLTTRRSEKYEMARKQLSHAFDRLTDPLITIEEAEEILRKSAAGSYWDKFGAIAGMFRAAYTYQSCGARGLIDSILSNKLPDHD